MQRDLLLCWHECTWPPTWKLSWQLAWWHYICSLICQQMEKEDYNFLALELQCQSESNIQQNVTPWGPEDLACLPPSALKRWSGQSWHCSHAKRFAAVLAWMYMASSSKALLAAWLVTLHSLLSICQQMEKEDYNFPAIERNCRSERNIQKNVHIQETENATPWRPSMPSAKCLKKMDPTIMALQPCTQTWCCVGILQLAFNLEA